MRNETEAAERDIVQLFDQLKADPAGALSALTAHAKKQALRGTVDRLFSDRTELYALLSGGEPKTRKNAARLLGALSRERDADALALSLQAEDTRFVIPSILLALGNAGGGAARNALTSYQAPEAADETEENTLRTSAKRTKKRSPRWIGTSLCRNEAGSIPLAHSWRCRRRGSRPSCSANWPRSDSPERSNQTAYA